MIKMRFYSLKLAKLFQIQFLFNLDIAVLLDAKYRYF